ncbi:hypothetical protein [Marinobacterium sp. xm-d-564]|uniref:hypothetical protein n=1 Tax=Marinobacterium sp. xm-d-564 TaxID=2497742 RepID=UPI0015683D59|nr:hypothetical protein [Marinobacterium sp. xm-d-564]NRP59895.1 hypothetical protein [Marinobacterium sp. xm-d-564]
MFKSILAKGYILYVEQGLYFGINFLLITFLSLYWSPEDFKEWAVLNMLVYMGGGAVTLFTGQPYLTKNHEFSKQYFAVCVMLSLVVATFIAAFVGLVYTSLSCCESVSIIGLFFVGILSIGLYDLLRKKLITIGAQKVLISLVLSNIALIMIGMYVFEISPISFLYYTHSIILVATILGIIIVAGLDRLSHSLHFDAVRRQVNYNVKFGSPLIFGFFIYWIYSNGLLIFLSDDMGDDDFGMLRVINNLLFFGNLILVVFENKKTNEIARIVSESNNREIIISITKFTKFFTIVYAFGLFLVGGLFFFLYEDSSRYSLPFLLISLAIYALSISKPFTILIKVMNKNIKIFLSHILTLIMFLCSYFFVYKFLDVSSVIAFTLSMLIAYASFFLSQLTFCRKILR